ncbi:MAG: DNA repair protein RecO [Coxiellaceae bacterium]|jgi:DNA repair protein RecO (recombination protein O)|nr:DNA repair protein RecO [Coxiellaceae bacterium]
MTINKIILQPAFVLHARSYRDTSLLVELLTKHYGRLTVVARGARSMKSRLRGTLVPFLPLLVTFSGKTDLKTLQQSETCGTSYALKNETLLSGFYLNELLIKLLPYHEAYPSIYDAYQDTLDIIVKSQELEIALRLFEKCLLANLGYGLRLDRTNSNELILAGEQYSFEFGYGFYKAKTEHTYNFPGKSLLALHCGNFTDKKEIQDAKRLLRSIIAILLGNKNLKSRELFKI